MYWRNRARPTLIFLLQHLGFVINFKKSVLTPARLWSKNRFSEIDLVTYPWETRQDQSALHRDMQGTSSFSFETDEIDRTFSLDSIDCPSSKNTMTLFPTSSKSGPESGLLIPGADNFEYSVQTGTAVVDSKIKIFKWQVPCEVSNREDYPKRCLKNGLGSNLPSIYKQQFGQIRNKTDILNSNLAKLGTKLAFWTASSKTDPDKFRKGQASKTNSLSNRQHNCLDISIENGVETKLWKIVELSKDICKYLWSRLLPSSYAIRWMFWQTKNPGNRILLSGIQSTIRLVEWKISGNNYLC